MRMGRQHPPEANARSGCGGQGEPAGSPAQEVQSPAAAQLRRPGTRGAEGEEQSLRPGAAARWTHMAGGRRPPLLPGPGRTLNLLSPGRASKARKTVLPSSPRSLTAAEPWGPTREEEPGRRRAPRGRAAAPPVQPPLPAALRRRRRLGRSAVAARGAPGLARRSGSAFGRRSTHRLLPSAARPSSLSRPLPSRPQGPGADTAKARRSAAGGDPPGARGGEGARPASARCPAHPRGGFRGSLGPKPPPAFLAVRLLPTRGWGRQTDREVREKVACPHGCSRGGWKTTHAPCWLFCVWYLGFKLRFPTAFGGHRWRTGPFRTGCSDLLSSQEALGMWSLWKLVNEASVGVGMRGENREPKALRDSVRQLPLQPSLGSQREMPASLSQETSSLQTSFKAFLSVSLPLSSLSISPFLSLSLPPFLSPTLSTPLSSPSPRPSLPSLYPINLAINTTIEFLY